MNCGRDSLEGYYNIFDKLQQTNDVGLSSYRPFYHRSEHIYTAQEKAFTLGILCNIIDVMYPRLLTCNVA